jgi:hypothetical protein
MSHNGRRRKDGCEGNFKASYGQPLTAYLGVRFSISGEIHYGWVQLSTACGFGNGQVSGRILGYAYNTVANQPIGAGQMQSAGTGEHQAAIPATLGALSFGSTGLPLRRRCF